MPLYFFYTMVQKSQNDQKLKSRGVLPSLWLKPNFETWMAIFKRFFLSESLSKIKCFGIFWEMLYHFKGPLP